MKRKKLGYILPTCMVINNVCASARESGQKNSI